MRNSGLVLILVLAAIAVQAQETEKRIRLKLFTPHWDNFEYVNGDVKEIHYRAYHVTDNEGEIVKGKPFTISEAENVEIRQPWSLYFNKNGDLVSMTLQVDENNIWTGVVHSQNNRIENIDWSRDDTLRMTHKIVYDEKGKVIREWISYPETEVNSADTFSIDKNGNVIKVSYFDQDGKHVYTAEYARYPDGSTMEMKGIDADRKTKHYFTDYKYNEHGLFESYDMKLLNYEKPNFPVEITIYEYDDHGNWVERTVRDWMMIERKIVYYD